MSKSFFVDASSNLTHCAAGLRLFRVDCSQVHRNLTFAAIARNSVAPSPSGIFLREEGRLVRRPCLLRVLELAVTVVPIFAYGELMVFRGSLDRAPSRGGFSLLRQ